MQIVINIRKKDIMFLLVGIAILGVSAMLYAGTVTIPNTFSSATTAKANEVNANFTAIKTAVDDNANTKAPTASPTFTGTVTAPNLVKSCPTGFTSIQVTASNDSVVRQLGCMQTAIDGTAINHDAETTCFTTYGGRLPTAGEWAIVYANFTLTGEGSQEEWAHDTALTDNWFITYNSPAAQSTSSSVRTATLSYRCWIPT